MPLIGVGRREEPASDGAHEWARKIRPQYAKGEPVDVAVALNQAEAELIAGVLLEAGIPSTQRRSGAADLPDFLAAGPRYVMVPSSAEAVARELLGTEREEEGAQAGGVSGDDARSADGASARPLWVRAMALLIAISLLFSAVATLIYVLVQ